MPWVRGSTHWFILAFCSGDLGASSKAQWSVLRKMPSHLQEPHNETGFHTVARWCLWGLTAQKWEEGGQRRLNDRILTELGLETQVWHEQGEKVEEPRQRPRPHRKQPPVDHLSALRRTPSTPHTLSNTHTFSLSPPTQVDSWLLPSF